MFDNVCQLLAHLVLHAFIIYELANQKNSLAKMTILPFSHSQFVLNPNVFFPLKHKTSNFEECPSCCFPGSQSE